jgi:ABC transporter substrate binding protein
VLSDPRITTPQHLTRLRNAVRSRDVELDVYEASTPEEIAPAIDAAAKAGAQAINVLASPLLSFNSRQIVDQLALLRLPAIYQWPEIAEQGGLLAYGPRITRTYRQMARQLMRLMRGANMADAPVEQPTVFELVANLKTGRAMDLQLPESFLTRGDDWRSVSRLERPGCLSISRSACLMGCSCRMFREYQGGLLARLLADAVLCRARGQGGCDRPCKRTRPARGFFAVWIGRHRRVSAG